MYSVVHICDNDINMGIVCLGRKYVGADRGTCFVNLVISATFIVLPEYDPAGPKHAGDLNSLFGTRFNLLCVLFFLYNL